jgi:hypothetical protein
MLKIEGHEIWRSGERAGYIDGNHIRNHDYKMLGYFSDGHVYNAAGHKIAYIEGNHLHPEDGSGAKISLDDVNKGISGGVLPELGKCAIYCLIGI